MLLLFMFLARFWTRLSFSSADLFRSMYFLRSLFLAFYLANCRRGRYACIFNEDIGWIVGRREGDDIFVWQCGFVMALPSAHLFWPVIVYCLSGLFVKLPRVYLWRSVKICILQVYYFCSFYFVCWMPRQLFWRIRWRSLHLPVELLSSGWIYSSNGLFLYWRCCISRDYCSQRCW